MIHRRLLTLGAPALLAGCGALPRLPAVPRERTFAATVVGLPNERFFYLDDPLAVDVEFRAAAARERAHRGLGPDAAMPRSNLLAVSGGGEDGAFGAGLLCGWSTTGARPTFNLVTGVSTGALTAPFAFLGPAYDVALREVYTDVTLADIAESRGLLRGMLNDALADTAPLLRTIGRHLDQAMLQALAVAYGEGRLLLVGTTNLDVQKPVVWNIGAIAASGHADGLELIRRILLASAAIPGAFPPVMIDVTVDGERRQEMHVDGGAFAQAFLYPQAVGQLRQARRRRGERVRPVDAYVIRNARLDPDWSSVDRRALGIAGRAISTMIFTSGFNDVVRMYNQTRADGVGFNLAFIGPEFTQQLREPFDQAYMRALFEYGFQRGAQGGGWVGRLPIGQPVQRAAS
jgi:hypothetical protein